MKSMYTHDVMARCRCLGVCVCIFLKDITSTSKIRYPVEPFDTSVPQTVTCQTLGQNILRYDFAKHEIAQ